MKRIHPLRYLILSLLFLTGVISSFGQARFQTYIGGAQEDRSPYFPSDVIVETGSGGFVKVGITKSIDSGNADILVSRLDAEGDLLWSKGFGGDTTDWGNTILRTEKGYMVGGATRSYSSSDDWDGLLFEIDGEGKLLWEWAYSRPGNIGFITDIERTKDGGIMIVGITNNGSKENLHVLKMDTDRQVEWETSVGDTNYHMASFGMTELSDGYIFACNPYTKSGRLLKLKKDGSIAWINDYSQTDRWITFTDVARSGDDLFITGAIDTANGDLLLLKTDLMGNQEWSKRYGGNEGDFGSRISLIGKKEEELVIYGSTRSYGAGEADLYLLKLDRAGNYLASMAYGTIENEAMSSGVPTWDGGYVLYGRSFGQPLGKEDIYIVKTDTGLSSGCKEMNAGTTIHDPLITRFPIQDSIRAPISNGYFPPLTGQASFLGTGNHCKECVHFPSAAFTDSLIGGKEFSFEDGSDFGMESAWSFGDGDSSSLKNPTHEYSEAGSYEVCLTSTNACGTDRICRTIGESTGITAYGEQPFRIFPNPSQGELNVQSRSGERIEEILVLDGIGRRVHSSITPSSRHRIDTREWNSGFYFLRIRGEEGRTTRKVVIP
jgi:hypothetical protein